MKMSKSSLSGLAIFATILVCSIIPNDTQQPGENCDQVVVDKDRIVCKCSKDSCHQLKVEWPAHPKDVVHVQSTIAGARFEIVSPQSNQHEGGQEVKIVVDTNDMRQTVMGFGGAFTDSTGWQLANLSSTMADQLIASYYGVNGLEYTYGRVPIAGSDFSTRPYSYDDTKNNETDYDLDHFELQAEDRELKIPFILKAMRLVESLGGRLRLFASPWSPPVWMKTIKSFVNGTLIDDDKIYESYAKYWRKFLEAYDEVGISFWGATVQNEGFQPGNPWNFMHLNVSQQAKLIKQSLGPMLDDYYRDKDDFKLMVGDDTLGEIHKTVPEMLGDTEVSKYVSGLALHWYEKDKVPYDTLLDIYSKIKDKVEFLLMTEACEGFVEPNGVILGDWSRAESYASDIMEDFKRYTSGWIDWNMALDETGGPNWANNLVDSPVIVDVKKDMFYKQPMYYALAHFSKFMLRNSVVVGSSSESPSLEGVNFIASLNKDSNHLVVVVLNKSDQPRVVKLATKDSADELSHNLVGPKSISSIVVKLSH